jgi:hypothetical protein
LKRERWGQVTGEFDLDHFGPQRLFPELVAQYENLVYACRRCNSVKLDQQVADPFVIMNSSRIRSMPDGTVRGADAATNRLILALDLNSPRLVEWRIIWMRIVALAGERDQDLWRRLVGFPSDLPDLRHLRPPGGNMRPAGIGESWAALAAKGELSEYY